MEKEEIISEVRYCIVRLEAVNKLRNQLLNNATKASAGVFMPALDGFSFGQSAYSDGSIVYFDTLGLNFDDLSIFRADIGQCIKDWCDRIEDCTLKQLERFIKEQPTPID